MRQIMEEYGKLKKVRIKLDRYGHQQQKAMICFSNEKEADSNKRKKQILKVESRRIQKYFTK